MYRTRRFDFYMLRELIMPTLLGLFLWTFVLLMDHLFVVAEKALQKNLGADLTFRLFVVGIPKLLVLSILMAVLLGTLIAMGRLSADHEWVALQSAGRGPWTVLRPVLIHGLVGTLLGLGIYAVVVPRMNYAVRNLRGEILYSSNLAADLRPRVFYDLQGGWVLFVDEIRPGSQRRLEDVLLIQQDPKARKPTKLALARFGDLYPATDGSGALFVDLYDGQILQDGPDPDHDYRAYRFRTFQRERIPPPPFLKQLLAPPEKVAQDLAFPELLGEVRAARQARRELEEPASGQTGGSPPPR